MTPRAKVLVGHSYWGRGGAEIAAMWILQSLIDEHEVNVITRGGWDLTSLNQISGTSIRPDQIEVQVLPNLPGGFGAIAHGAFKRAARHVGRTYDVCITASTSFDWGRPAIHFLSSATWNDTLRDRFMSNDAPARRGMLQRGVWALSSIAAGELRPYGGPDDWYVANSHWTARISTEFCPGVLRVIYPAVTAQAGPVLPWLDREDVIVWLGRISPEKRLEDAVEIVGGVRDAGYRLTLHVVGEFGSDAYSRAMWKVCERRSEWVRACGPLYGAQKQELLSRCRYGLNTCPVEAFGISTAEMAGSGMIVFVPGQTGQAEIVASPAQCYTGTADAVSKICRVLESPALQESLHVDASRTTHRFEPRCFERQVRDLVADYLRESPGPQGRRSAV